VEAKDRWKEAAALKHHQAHAELATMLVDGRPGAPRDSRAAFDAAAAGAKLGCAHSKGVLGLCYASGCGVQRDAVKGLQLGRESAAAGSCHGQFTVAYCCDKGHGTRLDKQEAARM
jgi:TPR repeat protein